MSFVAGTSVTREFNSLEQMDMIGEMVRTLTHCIGLPFLNHPHPQGSLEALSPQPAHCRSDYSRDEDTRNENAQGPEKRYP